MKTYLLKPFPPVEPQIPQEPPPPPSLADVSSQSSQPSSPPGQPILFIGLDVHNDSIAVSLAPSHALEVRRYGIIGGAHDDVLKLCQKLEAAHPDATLRLCYEAGPRG